MGEGGPRQRRSGALANNALETIFPALFHTASTLSGSLRSPPSPRGEGFVSRKAAASFRCLPHWGRGTASAVDRVLSHIVDLRRISSLSFIPLVPYPARFARHLPHAGKGDRVSGARVLSQTTHLRRSSSLFFTPPSPSNLRPFGAPPSIGRRECLREPLPLEGAAERSEAGLASAAG